MAICNIDWSFVILLTQLLLQGYRGMQCSIPQRTGASVKLRVTITNKLVWHEIATPITRSRPTRLYMFMYVCAYLYFQIYISIIMNI